MNFQAQPNEKYDMPLQHLVTDKENIQAVKNAQAQSSLPKTMHPDHHLTTLDKDMSTHDGAHLH